MLYVGEGWRRCYRPENTVAVFVPDAGAHDLVDLLERDGGLQRAQELDGLRRRQQLDRDHLRESKF